MPAGELNVRFGAKPYRLQASATHFQHLQVPQQITAVGGTVSSLNNGDSFIVIPPGGSVTAFPARSAQVPIIWDHGQDAAGTMNAAYGGGWPNGASNSVANMQNRAAPFQALGSTSISGPTPFTSKFLAGCHYDVNVSNGGNAAMVWPPAYAPSAQGGSTWYSIFEGYGLHDPNWWYAQGLSAYTYTATYVAGQNTFSIQGGIPSGFTTGDSNQLFSLNNTAFVSSQASPCNIVSVDSINNIVTMNKTALVSGTFGLQSVAYGNRDENVKKSNAFANSASPYSGLDWYNTNAPGAPKTNTAGDSYAMGQFNGVPANPDNTGHSSSWGASNNPANPNKGWRGGWYKWGYAAKWSSGTDGWFKYWEIAPNGISRLIIDYHGPTMYSGTLSSWGEAIGGYSRNQGAMGMNPFLTSAVQGAGVMGTFTQWRYFGNIYYDRAAATLSRFYLTNSPTFTIGDGNLAEIQPYTSYSPISATLVVNKGNLASGTGYCWFVDEANSIAPTLVKTVTLS